MALTNAQLALALRIVGDVADTVPAGAAAVITRQAAVARALVTAHAPTAPEDVADEAVIRLVGFLYDQSPAMPRANNPMVASGAAAILGPWHVARLIIPAGDQGDGAAIVALDGPAIVAALSALAGNARLPASAIRDLPQGQGGQGLTPDQLEILEKAVIIGTNTPSLDGRSLEFLSDGGGNPPHTKSINLEGVTHPVPTAGDVGDFLQATGAGVSDWTGAPEPAATRLVPVVGAGDVGRILTAPQAAGGQPVWLSNPGQTQAQVDARVKAGVADWAETGNTDDIPLAKLGNAPSGGGGGLTQAQVDARVKAGVSDWAETGDRSPIPEAKMPPLLDDFADLLSGGFMDPANNAATEAFVSRTYSTVADPANPSSSPFVFVNTFVNSPHRANVYALVRVPPAVDKELLRLVIGDASIGYTRIFPAAGWHQVSGTPGYWTVQLPDVPVGDSVRVQRFHPFSLGGKRIELSTSATPFVSELLNATRGIAITQFNRSVQQTLSAFTPTPFTLQSSDHGVLIVGVQAAKQGTALDVVGDADADGQHFLSVLRASAAYAGDAGTKGNGIEVASFDVGRTSAGPVQGTVKCYIARNASNQVGIYSIYEPASGALGVAADPLALTWQVALLRTDASTDNAAFEPPRLRKLGTFIWNQPRYQSGTVVDAGITVAQADRDKLFCIQVHGLGSGVNYSNWSGNMLLQSADTNVHTAQGVNGFSYMTLISDTGGVAKLGLNMQSTGALRLRLVAASIPGTTGIVNVFVIE